MLVLPAPCWATKPSMCAKATDSTIVSDAAPAKLLCCGCLVVKLSFLLPKQLPLIIAILHLLLVLGLQHRGRGHLQYKLRIQVPARP